MTTDDVLAALRDSCLGEQRSDRSLDRVASIARMVDFSAGHFIFREGEPASSIYVVLEGTVSIELKSPHRDVRLLTIGPGELLGWSPILQHGQLTASARTMSRTRAVELDAARLLALFDSDSQLGYDFFRATLGAMAKRLDATLLQLADVYSSP